MPSTITPVTFDLSTYKVYDSESDADVDKTVQGNLYTVEGVKDADGSLRKLSMGELVMVVCLAKAAEKEAAIIDLMKTMSDNTATLEGLTDIETKLLAGVNITTITGSYLYDGVTYSNAVDFLAAAGVTFTIAATAPNVPGTLDTPLDEVLTQIESKMDSLNSFSQQKMIELQSETNKRDQAYDLITNILKSLNTVEVGIVNNI
ncbi:MAG: hypothetical protein IJT83_11415 [Victivallales bacterium]|nr:hypothetical protein [Victivallales bacterium]